MLVSPSNIDMSPSSVSDGPLSTEKDSYNNKSSQPGQQRQKKQPGQQRQKKNWKGAVSATSQPRKASSSAKSQVPFPNGPQMPKVSTRVDNDLYHVQKKPRLDVGPENIPQQQQVFQPLQNQQNSMQLQSHNSQSKDLIYPQKIRHQQQQKSLQSSTQMQRYHMQQQHYQQLNRYMQQKRMQQVSATMHSTGVALCTQRLLDYMNHQRRRPHDNNLAYWRKFVAEYYAPHAKESWCCSVCNDAGDSVLGFCTNEATDAWNCHICHSKPRRGFEAIFETLPRLLKVKFDSGVIDELLDLDLPHRYELPFGRILLDYGKAVQQKFYKQSRVVHEGQLRVVFNEKLKILSWEFCVRHHEELLSRACLAPLVNHLVKVSEKCQIPVANNESDGKPENLQSNFFMLQDAVSHLVKNLEHSTMNVLRSSKAYFCRFKLAEVVNSMKDLIDFSKQHKLSPIASLQNYPRPSPAAKLWIRTMQEPKQQTSVQRPLTNFNNLNNGMITLQGLSSHNNNNCYMTTDRRNTNGNGTHTTYSSSTAIRPSTSRSNSLKTTGDDSHQVNGNEN